MSRIPATGLCYHPAFFKVAATYLMNDQQPAHQALFIRFALLRISRYSISAAHARQASIQAFGSYLPNGTCDVRIITSSATNHQADHLDPPDLTPVD